MRATDVRGVGWRNPAAEEEVDADADEEEEEVDAAPRLSYVAGFAGTG